MKNIKTLIIGFCLSLSSMSFAQTISGGEIYYDQISKYKYVVTAQVYRNCNGKGINKLLGFVISDSFQTAMNFTRVSISNMFPNCNNPCNNVNDSGNAGYEKHVYVDTVDFSSSKYNKYVKAGNCEVRFAIYQLLRDTAITTIDRSKFYLDAQVNLCLNIQKNSSPRFGLDPKFDVCCNYQMTYNAGFSDTSDNDSVVIDLAAPLRFKDDPVDYLANFNSQMPATPYCPPNPGVINCRPLPNAKPPRGFYFDRYSGNIIFTPNKCDELSVVRLQMSEYRKDSSNKFVLIGRVNREMNFKVLQCQYNNPPYITTPSLLSVCESKKICFNGTTKDDQFTPFQSSADTTIVDWNHGLRDAQFTINNPNDREKNYTICWTPTFKNSATVNRLAVKTKSGPCPKDMASYGTVIERKPQAKAIVHLNKDNCGRLLLYIEPIDSVNQNLKSYTYFTTYYYLDSALKFVKTNSKQKDTFLAPRAGKYVIYTTVNNTSFNCPVIYLDTIVLPSNRIVIAYSKDSLFCIGDSVKLTPLNDDFSQSKLYWYNNENGNNAIDSGLEHKFKLSKMFNKVWVSALLPSGCHLSDSVDINSRGAFTLVPGGNPVYLCNGQSSTLKLRNFKGTAPFNIQWINKSQVVGTDTSYTFSPTQDTQLHFKVSDSTGCTVEDSTMFKVTTLPNILMKDSTVCVGSYHRFYAQLTAHTIPISYEWYLNGVLDKQKSNYFDLLVNSTNTLKLVISSSSLCSKEKTINISYYDLPQFSILSDTVFNKANFIKMNLSDSFSSYMWSNGASTKNNDFWAYSLGSPGKYTLWCEVTDSNGCKNREIIRIRTNGRTGIDGVFKNGYLIYPNPVQDLLTIETLTDATFEIINSNGQTVLTGLVHEGSNAIDLRGLASGVYVLRVGGEEFKLIR